MNPDENKYTKMYLKYVNFKQSILPIHFLIYELKITLQLYL